jgi:excisionase family DNA binding protein
MTEPVIDPDTDRFMAVKEVAAFFDVRMFTIREWITDGKIKAVKVNGRWKILKSEVIRYANELYGEK